MATYVTRLRLTRPHDHSEVVKPRARSKRWQQAQPVSDARALPQCRAVAKDTKRCDQLGVEALKEWSITISAMLHGRQQVLLRRGGIREGAFNCGDAQFILFPTGYHTDPELCKPGTAIPYERDLEWDPRHADCIPIYGMAQAVDMFTTMNVDVFNMVEELHIWTDSFYEKRLSRRHHQPITAMLLRTWQFREPVILPQSESYWGCFSWLDMEMDQFVDAMQTARLVEPVVPYPVAASNFSKAKIACAEHRS